MKKRLFTPGPTPVPERVLTRMAEPVIHHRKAEFREIASRVNGNLKYFFQTDRPVLTLTSSGTGAVEASFVSLFSAGDKIVAVNGGKFGERWVKMPRAFGLNAVEIAVDWGQGLPPERLREILRAHPDARGVYITQSETSTGTFFDVRALATVVRECSDALVCVDAISGLGAHELRFDEWGLDVCVTGSQKGLMVPPGLAFIALSARAEKATKRSDLPKFYFDLRRALETYPMNDTPWTPAVSLIVGVDVALGMIREEGLESVWKRHARMAAGLRAGIAATGLTLYSASPSNSVTAIRLPESVRWEKCNEVLESKFGIVVAGGQDRMKGKIFRVSHLGYHDELDMVCVMAALERAFPVCGFPIDPGCGLKALQESFIDGGV